MFRSGKDAKVAPNHEDSSSNLDSDSNLSKRSMERMETMRSDTESKKVNYCFDSNEKNETLEDLIKFFQSINYGCIKDTTKWFLDVANVSIRLTVDDVMMAMTLFVLFADNIKLMTSGKSYDDDFVTVNAICLFAFIAELILNTWSKTIVTSINPFEYSGYLFTFFWFLDVIAILSMLPDIPWIADPLGLGGISSSVSSTSKLSKAGRVVRLVRLVRLVKLYKLAKERSKKARQEEEMLELVRTGVIKYDEVVKKRELYNTRQSKLGFQLSESTTQRVVVIVLVMVCVLPLLEVPSANYGPQFATQLLHTFNTNAVATSAAKLNVLSTFQDVLLTNEDHAQSDNLLRLVMFPTQATIVVNKNDVMVAMRDEALLSYSYKESISGTEYITQSDFSYKWLEYDNAMYSLLTTLFIALLLVVGSLVFTSDTQTMVIAPIERMMNMVEAVARDPLQPLSFDHHKSAGGEASSGDYETRLLESTIEKITGLLRVGFGEAGAGIISANLQTQDSGGSTAAVNPLLPGVRIYAVIGFCDIHHFEEINQLLTSDVLIFVNTIAEIVHSRVHYWGGQCNKNLGNAFVIIWRIGDELDVQLASQGAERGARGSVKGGMVTVVGVAATANKNTKTKVVDLRRVPGVDKLADHALVGYLKIIAEINRNDKILDYRHEPRLTHNGKKHFHVGMGFGLHAGWAIEGAVGSIHKVDATYLSPHVNMAARLETSSRQYGVPILISQNAFELFSSETQKMCRRVDVVTVKGSEVPIGIYTYDCLESQQFPRTKIQGKLHEHEVVFERCPEEEEALERRAERFRKMGFETKEIPPYDEDDSEDEPDASLYTGALAKFSPETVVFSRKTMESQEIFERDTDLLILRQHATDEAFQSTFKNGIEEYLDGNWVAGKAHLEKANALMKARAPVLGGDGPCATLLDYMQEFGPEAPSWWKGYRPLTAK